MPDFPSQSYIPEGIYKCRIEESEEKPSKNGVPGGNLKLRVIEGDHEGFGNIWDYWSLHEKALWKVEANLEAIAPGKFVSGGRVKFDWPDLVGLDCAVVLLVEDYLGKTKNSVDRYVKLDDINTEEENVPF